MLAIQHGWLASARKVPSPNFNPRPDNTLIRLVVIHNISLPPAQFGGGYIEQFFQNQLDPTQHPYFDEIKDLQVSAHVLITRLGEIVQFVSFDDRAWHAGRSCYQGVENCNDFSIGIELEGTDDMPFAEAQYQALLPLLDAIQQAYPATVGQVTGHSDIAPNRKTDPGQYFDWSRIIGK
ncbi:MAG: 1,6-anhydro-N-acetylmuramyl-L-alanine amidase AmpD [Pseudomonadota bacterium]|nr:1,6-anhydro-N-acetylmuramyl-L-alanine amidase AmpD [Pseudomonadota bacterium]